MYLSGCLRGLVPLGGKGTGDRNPSSVSVNLGLGLLHKYVDWTSGTMSGLPGPAWAGSSGSGTSSGHSIGAVSVSRLVDDPAVDSRSVRGIESNMVSSTVG